MTDYYKTQVTVLNSAMDWHIRNIEAHIASGITPSAIRAIISEATGALQLASKAEGFEELLKHL
jgi:hypothetical protein